MRPARPTWRLWVLAGVFLSHNQACDCAGSPSTHSARITVCGDGLTGGTEVCDSDQQPDDACPDGRFVCKGDCSGYDSSCGAAQCGNDVANQAQSGRSGEHAHVEVPRVREGAVGHPKQPAVVSDVAHQDQGRVDLVSRADRIRWPCTRWQASW